MLSKGLKNLAFLNFRYRNCHTSVTQWTDPSRLGICISDKSQNENKGWSRVRTFGDGAGGQQRQNFRSRHPCPRFATHRRGTHSSVAVGAITVTKSNLPNQDAEALGCTIEITPKTAPQNGAPFNQGNGGSGYEPLRGTGIIDVGVTAGGRFGGSGTPSDSDVTAYSDRPFPVVLSATYYDD